jgi:hypothetical protein
MGRPLWLYQFSARQDVTLDTANMFGFPGGGLLKVAPLPVFEAGSRVPA